MSSSGVNLDPGKRQQLSLSSLKPAQFCEPSIWQQHRHAIVFAACLQALHWQKMHLQRCALQTLVLFLSRRVVRRNEEECHTHTAYSFRQFYIQCIAPAATTKPRPEKRCLSSIVGPCRDNSSTCSSLVLVQEVWPLCLIGLDSWSARGLSSNPSFLPILFSLSVFLLSSLSKFHFSLLFVHQPLLENIVIFGFSCFSFSCLFLS